MKLRWKIAVGMMVLGLGGGALLFFKDNAARNAVMETRQALRQQGFKTDLAEFDFSTSPELRKREQALTNASFNLLPGGPEAAARRSIQDELNLKQMIASDAVWVVWQRARLPNREGADLWPVMREVFTEGQPTFDMACAAALAGPMRFELNANHGLAMLLRHLAAIKILATTLGQRAMLELHDGNTAAAWTNLMASTHLVTAWEVEPVEVSHLVRFACTSIGFELTWQMLQTNAWSDEQLRHLQQQWESVDYSKGLPETVAFMRAGSVATCELQRSEPVFDGLGFKEIWRSPRSAWLAAKSYWESRDYRQRGVFVDEKALLLHFRDREMEVRKAIRCPNWLEMRSLPGVTNQVPFRSTQQQSGVAAMLNLRQLAVGYQNQGYGFLGRAAEAEIRRQLLITAIALERYHRRNGSYPGALSELAPDFLKRPPTDFADGQPLRYRLNADGHFVLWSVGLDGIDHGGTVVRQKPPAGMTLPDQDWQPQRRQESDLVWPRPASTGEAEEFHRQQVVEQQVNLEQLDIQAAEWRWENTAQRQTQVENVLQLDAPTPTSNPMVQGRPLNEGLSNPQVAGTNRLSMTELLTLKQVFTGAEPETVTFEVPIAFDGLTNLGSLQLYIDPVIPDDSDVSLAGCTAGRLECRRAANGNCLLVWDTIYEAPGTHAVQAGLWLEDDPALDIIGPLLPFAVSNICQFSVESPVFNPEIGATLRAKLPEANARYSVDMNSTTGERFKTITGNTTNGVIKVFWDLMSERGERCTNQSFGTVFHITLTDSGRSQTMRGP